MHPDLPIYMLLSGSGDAVCNTFTDPPGRLPPPTSLSHYGAFVNTRVGMLYKADGDACIPPQIITCGVLPMPKGSGRVSADCTPIHPLTCDATCPEG